MMVVGRSGRGGENRLGFKGGRRQNGTFIISLTNGDEEVMVG